LWPKYINPLPLLKKKTKHRPRKTTCLGAKEQPLYCQCLPERHGTALEAHNKDRSSIPFQQMAANDFDGQQYARSQMTATFFVKGLFLLFLAYFWALCQMARDCG
jgi:hypothetical protein